MAHIVLQVLVEGLTAIKRIADKTIMEQRSCRDRIAILAAMTAEICPRLSHSEILYLNDLVSLTIQTLRVDTRIGIEMKQACPSVFKGNVPNFNQSQLKLICALLTSQSCSLLQVAVK